MPANLATKSRFGYYIALCLLAFMSLIFVREHFHGESAWWGEPVRDLALAFFPLGLSILFWEYWTRDERREEIKEYLESEFRNVFVNRLAQIDELEATGIVRVHSTVNNEELRRFIESARRRLYILVPFFVEPTVLRAAITVKVDTAGFDLKIIMLHPDSPFLKRRGEIIMERSPDFGKNEVRKSLSILKHAIGPSPAGFVEVRLYDSLPSVFLALADDRCLLGFHMNTGTALVNPHLEVQLYREGASTVLGRMIEAEFEKVTSDNFSQRVDLLGSITDQGDLRSATP
jgi:hypothetical protein